MVGSTGHHLTRGTRSSIITSVERETTQLRQFPSDRFRTGGNRNLSLYKYLGVNLLFPNMETRTCKECGATHPLDLSYFPSAGKISGVQYYRHKCIPCYSKQKNKEARVRIDKFREYKKTLKCNRCGYDDYRALEFHHTDDNKEGNPCVIARQKSWENVMEELNKCEVLCSNCHRIEHYTGH